MAGRGSTSGREAQVPLYVFPPSLCFYIDESDSHQCTLNVFNPSSLTIKYRVLSTASKRYHVGEPEGYIRPHTTVDICIQHRDIKKCSPGSIDKFKIQAYDQSGHKVIGGTVVTAAVLRTRDRSIGEAGGEGFESISSAHSSLTSRQSSHTTARVGGVRQDYESHRAVAFDSSVHGGGVAHRPVAGPHWILLVVGVVCCVILALPTLPFPYELSETIPEYLHCSVQCKLVAAFFLGAIALSIFYASNAGR